MPLNIIWFGGFSKHCFPLLSFCFHKAYVVVIFCSIFVSGKFEKNLPLGIRRKKSCKIWNVGRKRSKFSGETVFNFVHI